MKQEYGVLFDISTRPGIKVQKEEGLIEAALLCLTLISGSAQRRPELNEGLVNLLNKYGEKLLGSTPMIQARLMLLIRANIKVLFSKENDLF